MPSTSNSKAPSWAGSLNQYMNKISDPETNIEYFPKLNLVIPSRRDAAN